MAQKRLDSKTLQYLQQSEGYESHTHVELTNGQHANTYFNKDLIFTNAVLIHKIAQEITKKLPATIEILAGPMTGGLLLAQAVAFEFAIMKSKPMKYIGIPPSGLKRGQSSLVTGKRVVLIDDVIKTGQTLSKSVKAIEKVSGRIQDIIVLINWRSQTSEQLGLDGYESIEILPRPKIYAADDCPMCLARQPIEFPKKKS